MATDQNKAIDDDSVSDFDNSDEDLASLLGDDDDDIFAKKIYGNTPAKSGYSEEESPINKRGKEKTSVVPSPAESTRSAVDNPVDDILDHFIDTSNAFKPSVKKKNEHSLENNSLSTLKEPNSPPGQRLKHSDENISNSTENLISKPPKERRGSFFDDFLQNLSPKHKSERKVSLEKVDIPEEQDEMFGTYMPTTPKKDESVSNTVTKSPKRRRSLFKQVSFKDIAEDFPETDIISSKTDALSMDSDSKQQIVPESKAETEHKIKSKEKLHKNEDMDWENFFKETPKKSRELSKRKDSISISKKESETNKKNHALKRQTSADWLGLSENPVSDTGALEKKTNENEVKKILEATAQNKHSDASFMLEKELHQMEFTEQKLGTDFVSVDTSHITNSDRSRASPQKKSPHLFSHGKSTIGTSISSVNKPFIQNSELHFTHNKQSQINEMNNISSELQSQIIEQTKTIHSLQISLDESEVVRNKLLRENESIKQMYEEKLKAIENLYRSEKKSIEDLHKTMVSSLQKEFEIKIKVLEERLNLVMNEKSTQENIFKEKLENIYKDNQVEIQRLKELHNQSISMIKKDHEEALSRLQQLKNQEVETLINTHSHTKSLQYLSDQLEARANELTLLHNKVEERNQISLRERQNLLDTKETSLKALESKLEKQLENSESERTRLQQLVLRLEDRLQKLTMEGEEDRYEVQQMKAKLKVQQQYLEEEKKLNHHQFEKEKEKLRISQDSLLNEQKTVLLQLAQERQLLVQEKIDLQALSKHFKEEETKLNIKKMKEENYIQSQKQYLQQEENKIHFEKERVKQEFYQLEREQNSLQREKQEIKNERERLLELDGQLKRKAIKIEEQSVRATQELEKGHREYTEGIKIKSEQQAKMEKYSQDMQILMEKERQILLEKDKLIKEKLELEESKQSVLCTRCKLAVGNIIQAPTELHMPMMLPFPNVHEMTNQVQQSFVDPNLVIWQLAAQKDREFLQEELAYLHSLKASSQN